METFHEYMSDTKQQSDTNPTSESVIASEHDLARFEFGYYFAKGYALDKDTQFESLPKVHSTLMLMVERLLSETREMNRGAPDQLDKLSHYSILPLCRAIIIQIDYRTAPTVSEMEQMVKEEASIGSRDKDIIKRVFEKTQKVWICRTGVNTGLSKMIDFAQAPERYRNHFYFTGSPFLIRAPLGIAVRYIRHLQCCEEKANPQLYAHLISDMDRASREQLLEKRRALYGTPS
jgi:hypothetical protein